MNLTIRKDSRYLDSPIMVEADGTRYIGSRDPLDVRYRKDDIFHEVRAGELLDAISFFYYGNERFWWVIAEYNEISWGLPLEPGTILRMPSLINLELNVLG